MNYSDIFNQALDNPQNKEIVKAADAKRERLEQENQKIREALKDFVDQVREVCMSRNEGVYVVLRTEFSPGPMTFFSQI